MRLIGSWKAAVGLAMMAGLVAGGVAQGRPDAGKTPALTPSEQMEERDGVVDSAERLVGKALFLRGFYLGNELGYDAAGRVKGSPKVADWTLTAVNVLKVERRGPGVVELDGVRVAIRYNPDQRQFERHPQNDDKVKILVDAVSVKGFEAAVAAIFAVGIDPGLQAAMPEYWRHYFNPSLAWPKDELDGLVVNASLGMPNQPKDVIPPKVEHKAEAKMSDAGLRDKVRGQLALQMVVDAAGVPQRIVVQRPLGYGLEASAVEAMRKWRFSPGTKDGQPVATSIVVAMEFEYVAPPR